MASKLQAYAQMADYTAQQITGSYQKWTGFLATIGRLYKYPFPEQLLIHAQRPNATACAEYDTWKDQVGRYVRRGAVGIAIIDNSGSKPFLRYVFDVDDTGGEPETRPRLWEYGEEHAGAVSAAMANQADGLLTRDYLWLGDAANSILKRSELAGACLYQWTYYAGRKRLHATSLAVVDRRGRMISAEADTQRGKALLAFLAGQCPGLRVEERLLREGKEFDQWKKDLTADPA